MMTSRHITLAICIAFVLGMFALCGCDRGAMAKRDLEKAYKEYMKAISLSDSDAALRTVSESSLAVYDRLVELALDGTRAELKMRSPAEKFYLIVMRNRMTRHQLTGMTGKDFFCHAIERGWWIDADYDDDARYPLIDVKAGENWAEAHVETGFGPSKEVVRFLKEDNVWVLDEASFIPIMDDLVERYAREDRLSVDKWIMAMEEDETEEDVPDSLWDKLRK